MASLDEVREDYCDENLPVFLLLGLVSALRRLEPLLPPPGPPPACPAPAAGGPPGRERLLYLALGLVAFRGHLLSAMAPAAPRDTAREETPAAPLPGLRELLR
jgi:hypothetical protein